MEPKKVAIHVLIWAIALLFIFDQFNQMFSKSKADNKPVKSGSATSTTTSSSEPPPDPNAVILTGIMDRTRVEIKECVGSGGKVIIKGSVTNTGTDGYIRFFASYWDSSVRSVAYDNFGKKINPTKIRIANLEDEHELQVKLLSGLPTEFELEFGNMPTVRGQLEASKIVLLELFGRVGNESGSRIYKSEFRNIQISSKSTPIIQPTTSTPTPTPAPAPTAPIATPTPTPTPMPATPIAGSGTQKQAKLQVEKEENVSKGTGSEKATPSPVSTGTESKLAQYKEIDGTWWEGKLGSDKARLNLRYTLKKDSLEGFIVWNNISESFDVFLSGQIMRMIGNGVTVLSGTKPELITLNGRLIGDMFTGTYVAEGKSHQFEFKRMKDR